MALAGRPRDAAILKILRGTNRPDRRRDEAAVRPPAKPTVPPGETLDAAEAEVFAWLVAAALPGIHGTIDGGLFCRIAKTVIAIRQCEGRCKQLGMFATHPISGKPVVQPHATLLLQLTAQYRALMSEAGLSPAVRLRLAPLDRNAGGPAASIWDDFD